MFRVREAVGARVRLGTARGQLYVYFIFFPLSKLLSLSSNPRFRFLGGWGNVFCPGIGCLECDVEVSLRSYLVGQGT